jgi:hypothetical protein
MAAESAHATLASNLGLWENFQVFNAQFKNFFTDKHARTKQ